MSSAHRYELFEDLATKRPLVFRAGWSWGAFFASPLWALRHGFWIAAVGMAGLDLALVFSTLRSLEYSALVVPWLLLSWWIADDGNRWVIKRQTTARSDLRYICGSDASTQAQAEAEALRSIEIDENFIAACRRAPPEHVAQALAMLEEPNGEDKGMTPAHRR